MFSDVMGLNWRLFLPRISALSAVMFVSSVAAETYTPGQPINASFKELAVPFLDQHCTSCHDDVQAEADLDLYELGPVDETNAAVWKSVWAQVV